MAEGADFETAIEAAGFGCFNIILLCVTFFTVSATVFDTSSMSYIFPSAECYLQMGLLEKGILNASSFGGMIISAIPWGFIADTHGRKLVILYGCFINGTLVLLSSLCHYWTLLVVFKFFEGLAICGPFAAVMAYVSEMHGRDCRGIVMIFVGFMITLGSLVVPLLAVLIMSTNWHIEIGSIKYFSWQLFIAFASLPSLISGIIFIFLPESPKFLITQGRNNEAMVVFKLIYSYNHPKSKKGYPIKQLKLEKRTSRPSNRSDDTALQEFCKDLRMMAAMFITEYPWLTIFVCFLNSCILMAQNTFRLWLPQVFHSIHGYLQLYSHNSSSLCNVLKYSLERSLQTRKDALDDPLLCAVDTSIESFTNNFVVGGTSLIGFLIATVMIKYTGGKFLLCISLFLSAVMGYANYFTATSESIVAVASITVTCENVASVAIIYASVSLFPTQLRAMIVSLIMMCGRLGSVFGNVLFPVLIEMGCAPPFIFIGSISLVGFISSIFLPNPAKQDLK